MALKYEDERMTSADPMYREDKKGLGKMLLLALGALALFALALWGLNRAPDYNNMSSGGADSAPYSAPSTTAPLPDGSMTGPSTLPADNVPGPSSSDRVGNP
jgi:hypothetical protein